MTAQNPVAFPAVEGRAGLAHPEDPGHRTDPGQDDRHPGQPLHDDRQVVVDLGQVDVERRGGQLAIVVELVGQPDDVVVDVAEVDDLVVVDELLVAVGQLVEDLADRADRAPDLDELALELEHPLDGVRGRLANDLVLDVVDGVADPVREREVAVDQVVRDRPQEVVRPVGQDGRHAIRQVMTGPRVPVDVVDGQQEALAEDDVELRRHDRVAIAQVEQHDVDDPVGRLDLRPLVALEDVLDDQGVEAERLADLQRLGLRRGDEIDPDPGLRLAQQLGHPGHRGRALELDDAVARMATTRIVPG